MNFRVRLRFTAQAFFRRIRRKQPGVYDSAGRVYGAGLCVRMFSTFPVPWSVVPAKSSARAICRHPGGPKPLQVSGVFRTVLRTSRASSG